MTIHNDQSPSPVASCATAPRTVANEQAFCDPNYGHGKEAKYGKKNCWPLGPKE